MNDHCVVRAPDGRWHVFGITKPTPDVDPQQERWFCHGSGASLAAGGFEEHNRVCDFGARAWAPTVAFDGQRWIMLYGPDLLRAAVCDDATRPLARDAVLAHRRADPGGAARRHALPPRRRVVAALRTGKHGRAGAVSVCVSENLIDWRFVRFALRTTQGAPSNPPWGATESPFVFRHGNDYWLSITYTTSFGGPAGYHNTLLFRSTNPFDFGTYTGDDANEVAAKLHAHAPEYLRDPDTDRWYVTSAGWPGASSAR